MRHFVDACFKMLILYIFQERERERKSESLLHPQSKDVQKSRRNLYDCLNTDELFMLCHLV